MNGRPHVHFVIAANHAFVTGYHARQLLIDVGSRPVWGGIRKAWATVPHLAADAMALAEQRGWLVTVEREAKVEITREAKVEITAPEPAETLW